MKQILIALSAIISIIFLNLAYASSISLEAPGPLGSLRGTLLQPAPNSDQVMLIVPGSGLTDRDGNSPNGLKASTYKLLAEGLKKKGIATLRIDKRGMFGSKTAIKDPNSVSIPAYASDVHSWVKTIRAKTSAKCVWLLGHSEGGLVALVAAQNKRDVCGLLLIATPGRPLGTVLRMQLKLNPANSTLLPQAFKAIAALEVGKKVDIDKLHPALVALFRPEIQDFMINLFSYDPASLLSDYQKPVLILQGQKDLQIFEEDARKLAKANKNAKLVLLPYTNHILKSVTSDDMQANFMTYANPNLPLAPGVIEEIAKFVNSVKIKEAVPAPK